MPVIYSAKMDGSNAERYFHISLVSFYLNQAYESATQAKEAHKDNILFAPSVIAIMFSAMTLEAFANELSEDVIPNEDINDFIHLRKKYKKNKNESSVTAKYRMLFLLKHEHELEKELVTIINEIFSLRNNLVHYKLTELSGKHILPPVRQMECSDGRFMTSIDFMVQPETIVPPFISKINGESAAYCFNSTIKIIKKWGFLLGDENYAQGFSEIA